MEESRERIVDFHTYCRLCKHEDVNQNDDPCFECVGEPTSIDSRKPVKFEPKEN